MNRLLDRSTRTAFDPRPAHSFSGRDLAPCIVVPPDRGHGTDRLGGPPSGSRPRAAKTGRGAGTGDGRSCDGMVRRVQPARWYVIVGIRASSPARPSASGCCAGTTRSPGTHVDGWGEQQFSDARSACRRFCRCNLHVFPGRFPVARSGALALPPCSWSWVPAFPHGDACTLPHDARDGGARRSPVVSATKYSHRCTSEACHSASGGQERVRVGHRPHGSAELGGLVLPRLCFACAPRAPAAAPWAPVAVRRRAPRARVPGRGGAAGRRVCPGRGGPRHRGAPTPAGSFLLSDYAL